MDATFSFDSRAPLPPEKKVVETILFGVPFYVPIDNLDSFKKIKYIVSNEAKDAMNNAVLQKEYVSPIGVLKLYNPEKKVVEKVDSASGFVGGYLRMLDLSTNITRQYVGQFDDAIEGFKNNSFLKEKFSSFAQFYNTTLSMYISMTYVDSFPNLSISKSEYSRASPYNSLISNVEQLLLYADLECTGLFDHTVSESLMRCKKSTLEKLSMEFLSIAVLLEDILFENGMRSTPFDSNSCMRGIFHIPNSSSGIPEPISERMKSLDSIISY